MKNVIVLIAGIEMETEVVFFERKCLHSISTEKIITAVSELLALYNG